MTKSKIKQHTSSNHPNIRNNCDKGILSTHRSAPNSH